MTDNHERCVGRAKIRRRPNQIISRIANRMANMSLGIFYGFQCGVFLQALNWKTFLLMSSFPKPPLSDLCAKRDYSITSFFGNVFVLHKVGKPAQKKKPNLSAVCSHSWRRNSWLLTSESLWRFTLHGGTEEVPRPDFRGERVTQRSACNVI